MGDLINFPGTPEQNHPSRSPSPRPKLGYSGLVVLLVAISSFLMGLVIGLILLIMFG